MGLFDDRKDFLRGKRGPEDDPAQMPAGEAPSEGTLDQLFTGATRVRVLDGGVSGGQPTGNAALLTITRTDEITELRECLRIGKSGFHCMCLGSQAIEVRGAEGVRAVIGLHHGQSIRWEPAWKSDAMLADGRRLLEWLAARGVEGPLRQREKDDEDARVRQRAYEAWRAAMPPCLAPLWPELESSVGPFARPSDVPRRALVALRSAYPSEGEGLLALLEWFGKGNGTWGSFPSYEAIPGELLLELPTPAILGALEGRRLTPEQREGAARLLGGWAFGKRRSADRALVSKELREELRAHVAASPIEDNRRRFAAAFPS